MSVAWQTPALVTPLDSQVCDEVVDAESNRVQARVLRDVLSCPFYYLGKLSQTVSPELRASNYIVAVSLYDNSLWLIYNAWNYEYQVTEDDLEGEVGWDDDAYLDQAPIQEIEREKCFRPTSDPLWASFPGLPARTLMIRLANDVSTWHFDEPDGPELLMDPLWFGDDVVPVFICARLTSNGQIVRPRIGRNYAY